MGADFTGASGYRIQIADSEAVVSGTTAIDISASQYQVASGLEEGQYYWRVGPVNSNNIPGFWSSIWSFTVDLGRPYNPDPTSGSTIDDTTPHLGWEDVTGADGYHIQVNTASDFSGTTKADDDTLTPSEYEVLTVLDNNATYYWRVRIKDSNGVFGDWSSTWNFTVELGVPSSPNPDDGGTTSGQTPLLGWEDVIGAAGYHIQVNEADDFTGTVIADDNTTDSEYQIGTRLYINKPYYWRVKIQNEDEVWGDWSDTWNFSIHPTLLTLDSAGDVGWYISIAIDSADKVHISYCDNTNDDLKFATNASGSWIYITLDSADNVGKDTSIAIDSADKVHISYEDVTNDDLKYATNASGSWIYITLDSAENVGSYTSIAIDSTDKVYISYCYVTNGDLKYATNASGSWVYTTLDSTGSVGYYTSIAIDSVDKVHISYYDNTNGDLKYATW